MSAGNNIPLLLVEDDSSLAGTLADFLTGFGYDIDFAFNGRKAVELASTNEYAVIIMDVSMPIMDGLSACQRLRTDLGVKTPIIFLTARDTLDDKIAGYRSGGDDYLVKPFAPEELACRLEALRKRPPLATSAQVNIGNMTIHPGRLEVIYADKTLELHDTQIRLLVMLAKAAPEIVTKPVLEAGLWPDEPPESNPLRNYVYRLRRLLDERFGHDFIRTVHGKGYRIELPD
ncbi:MAG: response regulator transcription factor [Halioglobus sp.]